MPDRTSYERGTPCSVDLVTPDPAAATGFYTGLFGWDAHLGGPHLAGMIQTDEQWPAEVASHWMVYFAVPDCDVTAARAAQLGDTVPVPPSDIPTGRFAVLNDPQGGYFSVIARGGPAE